MFGTELVPETSVIFNQLTRVMAREDFINVSRRESFTSYIHSGSCEQVLMKIIGVITD
jgi:hypothetical protein